jgi:hypothetical protein
LHQNPPLSTAKISSHLHDRSVRGWFGRWMSRQREIVHSFSKGGGLPNRKSFQDKAELEANATGLFLREAGVPQAKSLTSCGDRKSNVVVEPTTTGIPVPP